MNAKYSIGTGANRIVLAHECATCEGRGKIIRNPEVHAVGNVAECSDCDGMGCWPTEDGVQLYGFIRDVMLRKGKW